tara:strand:- start:787 stop:1173 length:387 start_codon:yes stop_codon:yes gene_type:complete
MDKSNKSKSIVITKDTTLSQLIELGIIKSSQIDTWNKRLTRKSEKRADSLLQERCHFAVAFYIGATYKPGYENRFRKKPIEKALLSSGISRSMMDKSIKHLVEEGLLVNNADSVNNQCHTRHWIPEAE